MMARLIYALWEVCQMTTICHPYRNDPEAIRRLKVELLDYRMSSTYKFTKLES